MFGFKRKTVNPFEAEFESILSPKKSGAKIEYDLLIFLNNSGIEKQEMIERLFLMEFLKFDIPNGYENYYRKRKLGRFMAPEQIVMVSFDNDQIIVKAAYVGL